MATKKKAEAPLYSELRAELDDLILDLEGDSPNLDELGAKVERAAELLGLCQAYLKRTELRVEEALTRVASLYEDDED